MYFRSFANEISCIWGRNTSFYCNDVFSIESWRWCLLETYLRPHICTRRIAYRSNDHHSRDWMWYWSIREREIRPRSPGDFQRHDWWFRIPWQCPWTTRGGQIQDLVRMDWNHDGAHNIHCYKWNPNTCFYQVWISKILGQKMNGSQKYHSIVNNIKWYPMSYANFNVDLIQVYY